MAFNWVVESCIFYPYLLVYLPKFAKVPHHGPKYQKNGRKNKIYSNGHLFFFFYHIILFVGGKKPNVCIMHAPTPEYKSTSSCSLTNVALCFLAMLA